MLRIGIVAGESSGDQLGAELITELKALEPAVEIHGMCGPKMRDAGCIALADIESLSVMGLVEVLRKYPQLRRLRNELLKRLLALNLDIFVGIDVPDFVHYLEKELKSAGVKTVHLVAPQVWAWRSGRAKRLRDMVDLLLVLFPFEPAFFTRYGVNTRFVGHPLVRKIADPVDRRAACEALDVSDETRYIALMPGSRKQEIRRHSELFCQVAFELAGSFPSHHFLIGAVNTDAAEEIEKVLAALDLRERVRVIVGKSHQVLAAADGALLVSGTVTMEALVSKTPMVVAIRIAGLSYQILRRMVKVPFVAMPNVLAGKEIVPEFVQDEATIDNLAGALKRCLSDQAWRNEFRDNAEKLRQSLIPEDKNIAAQAVLDLVG